MSIKLSLEQISTLDDLVFGVNMSYNTNNPIFTENLVSSISSWNNYQTTVRALKHLLKPGYTPSTKALKRLDTSLQEANKQLARHNIKPIQLADAAAFTHSYNDLQRLSSQLKLIGKKGSFENVSPREEIVIYKWQKDIIDKFLPQINKIRETERSKLEKISLLDINASNYFPLHNPIISAATQHEFDTYFSHIMKVSMPSNLSYKAEIYKNNYIKKVLSINNEEIRSELLRIILNMNALDMYNASQDDSILSLHYLYEKKITGNPLDTLGEIALEAWKDYLDNTSRRVTREDLTL